ncbi:small ribosomal subunit protein uS11 [Euwallacea fornicatus]|uniref:small ribosomal subunit protein uS11 n=1 Tax=Euwallacea fornicatus TaxID=995702 RepID=UPI00338E8BE7
MYRNVQLFIKTLFPRSEPILQNTLSRSISTNLTLYRDVVNRKEMLKSLPTMDEGTAGEKTAAIDQILHEKQQMFPTSDSANRLFDGVPFKNLPIVNVRVSHNNTIFNFTDAKGTPSLIRSCGIEGYKNTRKGTNIAAQATAVTFGSKVLEKGFKTVRVRVQGLGPGRMSGIKGLQMAGLNIISITDNTKVSWNPPRARKQRKL